MYAVVFGETRSAVAFLSCYSVCVSVLCFLVRRVPGWAAAGGGRWSGTVLRNHFCGRTTRNRSNNDNNGLVWSAAVATRLDGAPSMADRSSPLLVRTRACKRVRVRRDARDFFVFSFSSSFKLFVPRNKHGVYTAVTSKKNTNNRHYTRSRATPAERRIRGDATARRRRRESLAAMTVHRSSGCHNTAVYAGPRLPPRSNARARALARDTLTGRGGRLPGNAGPGYRR